MSQWNPAQTWIFAVGVLEFQSKDFSRFKQDNRRDAALIDALRQRGVPSDRIVYLQDKHATLHQIRQGMPALLKKAQPGDMLIFYYCGHGYHDDDDPTSHFLANYDVGDSPDTRWSVGSVIDDIETSFGGSQAVLVADCCLSGSLADALQQRKTRLSYGVLASSLGSESSTGNWTFTQAVLDGFTGAPMADVSADGVVDFDDLARHAHDDMALFEGQLSEFVSVGSFDPHLELAKATPRPPAPFGERLEVLYEDGSWYPVRVLEARDGKVKVRWIQIGWDTADSDAWVKKSDTRPIQQVQYPVGAHVKVDSGGDTYGATILKVDGSVHMVHYDDYSNDWDEWVSAAQITPG